MSAVERAEAVPAAAAGGSGGGNGPRGPHGETPALLRAVRLLQLSRRQLIAELRAEFAAAPSSDE